MADLDFEDSDALLTEEELQRRDALLAGAEDEETMDGIRELFERIAAEREEQREAWEAKLGVTAGEEGDAGASGGKGKRKPEPNLRQGWDDKRSSGDPAPAPAAAPASEAAAGEAAAAAAAAAAPAGGEEGGAAAEAEKVGGGADPLAAMAAATVFNVDPSKLTPEQFDAAYAAHCKERAKVEWAALQEIKEDSVLGSLWRCAAAVRARARCATRLVYTLTTTTAAPPPPSPPSPPPARAGTPRRCSSRRPCPCLRRAWRSSTLQSAQSRRPGRSPSLTLGSSAPLRARPGAAAAAAVAAAVHRLVLVAGAAGTGAAAAAPAGGAAATGAAAAGTGAAGAAVAAGALAGERGGAAGAGAAGGAGSVSYS